MNKYIAAVLYLFSLDGMHCASSKHTPSSDAGFVSLFDGKTLKGWEGDPTYWKVDNETILGEVTPSTLLKRNSFLIWRGGITRDFELKVEFLVSAHGNSGINYRSEEVPGVAYALRGYQADLDGAKKYTGSNYEERLRTTLASRGEKVLLPALADTVNQFQQYSTDNFWKLAQVESSLGNPDSLALHIKDDDWNEYHLIVKGNHLQHYLNGVLMSDVTDNDTRNLRMSGLLGVQVHVGPPMTIRYRNFLLKQW